ncbi:MAG: NAD-glutamate dehydrogenase domain-containing protein [Caulobacteraceae bacterium]
MPRWATRPRTRCAWTLRSCGSRWWARGPTLGSPRPGASPSPGPAGRIDTDAIDNSAGVDTSDHEVNIKILTSALEAKGELTRPDRDNPPPVHDRRGRRPWSCSTTTTRPWP